MNRKIVIEFNGLFWGLSNWFENSISIHHEVFYVWWLEYGPPAKELINHLIQASLKVMRKLFIISFLGDHGLFFLILSNAHHEIKYFFEIACNHTPFILTCIEQLAFMTNAKIFLHFEIDVSNLCRSPTFAIISSCFTFLSCMRAKTSTCSQFAYRGFLNYTFTKEFEFWFMCFLLFCFSFDGSIGRSLFGCDSGCAINFLNVLLMIISSSYYNCLCCLFICRTNLDLRSALCKLYYNFI